MRASLPYSENLPPGQSPGRRFCVWKLSPDYGVGDAAEVVVDSMVLPSVVAGVIVAPIKLQGKEVRLTAELRRKPERWRVVYEDDVAVVFVRR